MAFVYRSQQNAGLVKQNTPQDVGPGTYQSSFKQIQKENAKSSAFQSNVAQIEQPHVERDYSVPGPGQYQVSQPTVQEQIVVSSANNDIKIVELPKPLSVFNSATKRFNNQISENPGPGEYTKPILSENDGQKSVRNINSNSQNVIDTLMMLNKYHSIPSIPTSKQAFGYTETENLDLVLNKNPNLKHTGMQNDNVGPGYYEPQSDFNPDQKSGAIFAQFTSMQLPDAQPVSTVVGPGSYDSTGEITPIYQLKPTSAFMSQSKRGTFGPQVKEQRMRDSKSAIGLRGKVVLPEEIENLLQQSQDDDDGITPGPGAYNSQGSIMLQTVQRDLQYFGRSETRFQDEFVKTYNVGPGDYNPNNKLGNVKTHMPPFLSSNTRFDIKTNPEAVPGPGLYENKQTLQRKLEIQSAVGRNSSFGSSDLRFQIPKSVIQAIPGPGSYYSPQNINIEDQVSQETSAFKSQQPRQLYSQKIQDTVPPVGAYQTNYFDLSKKVAPQQEEDQELKIVRPGFLFGAQRFQQPQKKIQNQEDDDETIPLPQETSQFCNVKQQNIKNLGFESQAPRFKETKQKIKVPGPGSYYDNNNNPWMQRTYNILFAQV